MMSFEDFGLGVLASLLASKIDNVFKSSEKTTKPSDIDESLKTTLKLNIQSSVSDSRSPKFKTFDAWTELSALLAKIEDPVISVLIEDQPSTHYRLASLVLESRATGEWYVFPRGRISFEGNGGGIRNSRDILTQVKSAGASIGVWVLQQNLLNELDNGYELWPSVRHQAIPLLAAIRNNYSWLEIEENVKKLA